MKRHAQILILLLTTSVWLLSGVSSVQCEAVDYRSANFAEKHGNDSETALFTLSSSSAALPIQVEKVRITSIQLSARQLHRLISESVFGHPASVCNSKSATLSIVHSLCILPGLAPPDISFPFSSFW